MLFLAFIQIIYYYYILYHYYGIFCIKESLPLSVKISLTQANWKYLAFDWECLYEYFTIQVVPIVKFRLKDVILQVSTTPVLMSDI